MQKAGSKGAELKHNNKEDALLGGLLNYVLPFFGKNNANGRKNPGRLEELVKDGKTALKPLELVFLEDLIRLFMEKNAGNKHPIKRIRNFGIPEFFETDNAIGKNDEDEIRHSIAFERKKEQKSNAGYSVGIKYQENESEESLSIGIKFRNSNGDYSPDRQKTINDAKQKNNYETANNGYSIILTKEKGNKEENKAKDNKNGNYSIILSYENNYEKERLSIAYLSNKESYLKKREQALHDFSDRVPGKHVSSFSRNEMPGVLGFTYLGQDRMALRDDLIGKTRRMVDIHESIHTPDEYETRVLTDWIMAKPKTKYVK